MRASQDRRLVRSSDDSSRGSKLSAGSWRPLDSRGSSAIASVSISSPTRWTSLCELWWEQYRETPTTAKDILELAKEHDLLIKLRAGRSARRSGLATREAMPTF